MPGSISQIGAADGLVARGSSEVFTLAPAVEYNWSSSMGVIVGTVFTAAGRNASANIVPVAAINMVF